MCQRGNGSRWHDRHKRANVEAWHRLFATLTGEAASDAATIRQFCAKHGVAPAEVMRELLAARIAPAYSTVMLPLVPAVKRR
jgi:hypothetical protein